MSKTALASVVDTVREAQEHGTTVSLSPSQIELLESASGAVGQMHPVAWRYVSFGDETPPKAGVRIVDGRYVEVWRPDVKPGPRMEIRGYEVRQSRLVDGGSTCDCIGPKRMDAKGFHLACGRHVPPGWYREGLTQPKGEALRERLLTLQKKPDDEYLNGFYATMPGDDYIRLPEKPERFMRNLKASEGKWAVSGDHYDVNGRLIAKGQRMRGGKEITKGRPEYERTLKEHNFEPVDSGYFKDVQRNAVRRKQKEKQRIQEAAEKIAHKYFPMSNRIGEI
jgi:hypothetical protein